MPTQRDLDLARRLLGDSVLTEQRVKEGLQIQAQYEEKGRRVTLEQVLYARGDVPKGALAPLSAPPLTESQPFQNYRIDEEMGEGGMGTVYAGLYVPNRTPVAVKVLDPVKALRELHRDRFHHEAKLHIELEHENLVAGYEVGFQNGYHFYTMDLVDGLTVLEVIERRGRISNEEALSITLQAAHALQYLHEQGYIHRDIKPGNIMVEPSGHARMIDLGLVGRMPREGETIEEDSTTTVGTVEYLSPEQARGRGDLDARADIYSLGMTLYHMVVGEVAFQGESDYEVMAQQILSSMDTQKIKTSRIDPEIYFLITKMSSKDRDERWSSVGEAIQVIEGYLPHGIVEVDLGEEPADEPEAAPPVARPIAPKSGAPKSGAPKSGAPKSGAPKSGAPTPTRAKGDAPQRTRGSAPRRTRRRRGR